MEEKERYSWFNHSTEEIYDNKENIVFVGAITVLNQQNRRIWELVEENKQLKKQLEIFKISNDVLQQDNLDLSYDKLDTAYEYAKEMAENWEKDYQEENQQLKQQLAITEKALELACERVKYFEEMQDREMGHFEFFGYDNEYDLQSIIEQYKQQAKEMLENE